MAGMRDGGGGVRFASLHVEMWRDLFTAFSSLQSLTLVQSRSRSDVFGFLSLFPGGFDRNGVVCCSCRHPHVDRLHPHLSASCSSVTVVCFPAIFSVTRWQSVPMARRRPVLHPFRPTTLPSFLSFSPFSVDPPLRPLSFCWPPPDGYKGHVGVGEARLQIFGFFSGDCVGRFLRRFRDADLRRSQDPLIEHIARLRHRDDRAFLLARHNRFEHGLVFVGIELLPLRRELLDVEARKRLHQALSLHTPTRAHTDTQVRNLHLTESARIDPIQVH